MHRLVAILLLALLPLQFSWAAVAAYCGHEEPADATHFGHHAHQHLVDARSEAGPAASADAQGDKAPGAMDLDCSHCHGCCSMMPTLPSILHGASTTAPPSAPVDEAGGAHTPSRPERPQWLPLA